jgi:hypothetical protein
MVKKRYIAHELGHVMAAMTFDNFYIPSSVSLIAEGSAEASCEFDTVANRELSVLYDSLSKIRGLCNIGGIMGEMLVCKNWCPWSARNDIDEMASLNPKIHPLIRELLNWLWLDTGNLSFHHIVRNNFKNRQTTYINIYDTSVRLPELTKVMGRFYDTINTEEFVLLVNEIYKDGKTKYGKEDLFGIAKRIIS